MTETQTFPATWYRRRDKYGRSCHDYISAGRTLGVVVKLPKPYTDKYPGQNYLANDWSVADRDAAVTYHATLREAKTRIEMAHA